MIKYLVIISFVFVSCNPLLKMAYGIKTPSPQSIKKIEKYIDKYSLNNFEHLLLDSIGFKSFVTGHFHSKENATNTIGVVDFIVMDSNGVLYNSSVQSCISDKPPLDSIINLGHYIINNSYSNFSEFYDLSGNSFELISNDNELIIFITWATYAGKLNNNINEEILENIQSISQNKKVYYLNLDIIREEEFSNENFN